MASTRRQNYATDYVNMECSISVGATIACCACVAVGALIASISLWRNRDSGGGENAEQETTNKNNSAHSAYLVLVSVITGAIAAIFHAHRENPLVCVISHWTGRPTMLLLHILGEVGRVAHF